MSGTWLLYWFIQIPGWLLFVYLVIAQCLPVFDYSVGVRMGTQEPAERITEVGVAFFKGFCGADLVIYTPLLGIALILHSLGADGGNLLLAAVLGMTVYWPIVCLWSVAAARGKENWDLPKEHQYWIVLPVIALWGATSFVGLFLGAI